MRSRIFVKAHEEVIHIIHLPLVKRLCHAKARRTVKAIGIGGIVMISASLMASYGHHQGYMPQPIWDAVAYFMHGVGGVPVVRYFEPAWALILGEIEYEN